MIVVLALGLQEAIPYLSIAESDFQTLEMYPSLRDVQYLLSVVYHNLGMKNERQGAATRHSRTEEHLRQLEAIVSDDQILEIFELLTTVGAALASR